MSDKIIIPTLGESVTEATVSRWLKNQGEKVSADEPIVELETDKVNVEVPAPSNGILENISVKEGETVNVGTLLGIVNGSTQKNSESVKDLKKYSPPKKKSATSKNFDEKTKPLELKNEPKKDVEKKSEEPLILDNFKKKNLLPVVKPGTQTRRFTHINDTVEVCYLAWKKNLCRHYSISHKESYSILGVAKLFNRKIKFLPKRAGERYASALTNMNLSNRVYKYFGKIRLKDYVREFVEKNT